LQSPSLWIKWTDGPKYILRGDILAYSTTKGAYIQGHRCAACHLLILRYECETQWMRDVQKDMNP
jgi:hypothetical protein